MRTTLKILAVALIAGGTMFAQTRLSIGVGIGGYGSGYYPPPASVQYDSQYDPQYDPQYRPPRPGPDYTWVDSYWNQQGSRRVWMKGFWRRPMVTYRAAPRYVAPRYYNSYRGYDRNSDHDRNRGYDNRYQNRNGERNDNRGNDNRNSERHDDRGNGSRNGFRR